MLPLWHTHVFCTSFYFLQHTRLSYLSCSYRCPCLFLWDFLFVRPPLHIPRSSVNVKVTILNLVSEYRCQLRDKVFFSQCACFLPLYNTTSYLSQYASAILGCKCNIHSPYVCHFLEFLSPSQNKKEGKVLFAAHRPQSSVLQIHSCRSKTISHSSHCLRCES